MSSWATLRCQSKAMMCWIDTFDSIYNTTASPLCGLQQSEKIVYNIINAQSCSGDSQLVATKSAAGAKVHLKWLLDLGKKSSLDRPSLDFASQDTVIFCHGSHVFFDQHNLRFSEWKYWQFLLFCWVCRQLRLLHKWAALTARQEEVMQVMFLQNIYIVVSINIKYGICLFVCFKKSPLEELDIRYVVRGLCLEHEFMSI